MIWPAAGVTADHLANTLTTVKGLSQPILAGAHGGEEVVNTYLRWANDAGNMLRSAVRAFDLDRLVYTPRYWATLANPNPIPAVVGAVNQETQQRQRDIEEAVKEAQHLRDRWACEPHGRHLVVPDTGVLLNHKAENGRFDITDIDWRSMVSARTFEEVRVVIPLVVVDELELIKDNRGAGEELRNKARWAVNQIFDWFHAEPQGWQILRQRSAQGGGVAIELLPDERGHVRLPRTDDELVDRAAAVKDLQSAPVHFVSYDSGAVLRANLAALKGIRLRDQPAATLTAAADVHRTAAP